MFGKYNAKKYFTFTFLFTILFWTIAAYYSFEVKNQFYVVFLLLGLIVPFVIALVFLFIDKNGVLKKEFKTKFTNFRDINKKTLPFFFLLMPFSVVLSIAISLLFGESTEQFAVSENFSFSTGAIPILLLLFLAATFEELGWRGYGFESLEQKYNFFYASLIFSVLWSAWHLPLSFVNNSYQYIVFQESVFHGINFYLSIIPLGFIISWIWIKNSRNIPMAISFHYIINLSQEAFNITQNTKMIQTIILTIIAIIIVYKDKELFFNKSVSNEK
ncbi:MAG: CPBP family intramembrane metalloprotease [Sulfurimonas sp.]|nr:MAG: CPBP family intramembrane metalloprotease [Sulfurimonas sp.]